MTGGKYSRTYHFPFSPGTSSDDRIHHEWETILQHELVMTEKLDGENNCLARAGVFARSHGTPTRNPWARNVWTIWERVKRDLGELEIFGENLYAIHSIPYKKLEHHFYVFAIRDGDTWLSWEEVNFYAGVLDLPTVPVVKMAHFDEGNLRAAIDTHMAQGSALGGGPCEGFVFRNKGAFLRNDFRDNVLKYVRANHVKTDEHWTRNWQRAPLYWELPDRRTDA